MLLAASLSRRSTRQALDNEGCAIIFVLNDLGDIFVWSFHKLRSKGERGRSCADCCCRYQ